MSVLEVAKKHLRTALEKGYVELDGETKALSDPSVKQLLSLCMFLVKNGLEIGETEPTEEPGSLPLEMLNPQGLLELPPEPSIVHMFKMRDLECS